MSQAVPDLEGSEAARRCSHWEPRVSVQLLHSQIRTQGPPDATREEDARRRAATPGTAATTATAG